MFYLFATFYSARHPFCTLPYRKNVKPVDAALFSGLKQKIYLFCDARRRQCDKFQVANTEGYNSYLKTQCQEVRVHKFPLQMKIKKTNISLTRFSLSCPFIHMRYFCLPFSHRLPRRPACPSWWCTSPCPRPPCGTRSHRGRTPRVHNMTIWQWHENWVVWK